MSAFVVVDLGFGDSGKGTITDFLVRETGAKLVVRWNGGAQAGHTVVTDDGRAHTFAQFGAGTFVPGVRTHLAEPVVVHPTALLVEARHLERKGVGDALARLSIAESARIITPFHQSANRLRELARGAARHGTCGVGVGEAVRDALAHRDDAVRARHLRSPAALERRARDARERLRASLASELEQLGPHPERDAFDEGDVLARWVDAACALRERVVPDDTLGTLLEHGPVVLEGAQGLLLDERYGFHPHTTWTDCTAAAATSLLEQHGHRGLAVRIGVLRTYLTRHGEGPFATHDPALSALLPELHNGSEGWQGEFRVGFPDLVLARYAARLAGVDALAITHLDREPAITRIATSYDGAPDPDLFVHDRAGGALDLREGGLAHQERLGIALRRVCPRLAPIHAPIPELFSEALDRPIAITSAGPTARAKRRLRAL